MNDRRSERETSTGFDLVNAEISSPCTLPGRSALESQEDESADQTLVHPKRGFFLSEHTQFDNLGDVVLNIVLAERLAKCGYLFTVKTKRKLPAALEAVFSEICLARIGRYRAIYELMRLRMLGRSPILVLNPGGHHAVPLKSLLTVIFVRSIGVTVLRIGVSISMIEGRFAILRQKFYERLCSYTVVRDEASLTRARRYGNPKVTLAPDLAFLFRFSVEEKTQNTWREKPVVGVSLRRVLSVTGPDEQHREAVDCILNFFDTRAVEKRFFAQVVEDSYSMRDDWVSTAE